MFTERKPPDVVSYCHRFSMSRIKPVFRCDEALKRQFGKSKCLLTISVGQETHEGERFFSTIDLIQNTFSSCTIALHDSLQRYTMALDYEGNEEDLHSKAASKGDDWITRNEKYYKKSKIPVIITRWDDWLNDSNFGFNKEKILREMHEDESYRGLFNQSIVEYLARYCRRLEKPGLFDMKRAEKLCLNYLLEECAVLCLWSKTGCDFELYAGKHNVAMVATRKRFVSSTALQSVTIGFNRRPDLKPQNFNFSIDENYIVGALIRE